MSEILKKPFYLNIGPYERAICNALREIPTRSSLVSRRIFAASSSEIWDIGKVYLQNLVEYGEIEFFHLGEISTAFQKDPNIELEALQIVQSYANKLTTLTIKSDGESEEVAEIRRPMKNIIQQMESLVILEIDSYAFTVESLTETCLPLRLLKAINVKILYQDPTALFNVRGEIKGHSLSFNAIFKKTFENLETFIFTSLPKPGGDDDHSAEEFQREMTNFCIFMLPGLEFVGDLNLSSDMTDGIIRQKAVSRLQSLHIKMNAPELFDVKNFNNFPEVKTLSITFHDMEYLPVSYNLDSLLTLGLISKLQLNNLHSSGYLEFFLKTFGNVLEGLNFTINPLRMTAFRITSIYLHCPVLQSLVIKNIRYVGDDAFWTFRQMHYLRTLVLEVWCGADKTDYVCLKDVLSPSSLESVTLKGLTVKSEDLEEIRKMIDDKMILRDVKSFTAYFIPKIPAGDQKFVLKSLEKVLREKFFPCEFVDISWFAHEILV